MESGSTIAPEVDLSQSAKRSLACLLASRTALRNPTSSTSGRSLARSPSSVIQPSPIASVIHAARAGFADNSQRRGVTPLVLLLKRSGNISARSLTVFARNNLEWREATPFVLWD